MTDQEFVKLQKTQAEIMDEVHRICEKYGITYYMIGGTLLGAVRHKGFIPWDFDIDIAMPRESYQRFKAISMKEMDKRYRYRDYFNTRNFNHPHALVCIENTELYNINDQYNPGADNYGIFIDIFPLDVPPSSEKMQERQAKTIAFLKKLRVFRAKYYFSGSIFKRSVRNLIRWSLAWLSMEKINAITDKEMQKYNQFDSGLLCSMSSGYSYKKQCMSKHIYGKPTLMQFSGRQYYGVEHYDEYLKQLYGDYMKLPSREQQRECREMFQSVVFDR